MPPQGQPQAADLMTEQVQHRLDEDGVRSDEERLVQAVQGGVFGGRGLEVALPAEPGDLGHPPSDQVAGDADAAAAAAALIATQHTADDAVYGTLTQVAAKVAKGDLVLNVKDYGAIGDGAANDTAAIQAALDAVPVVGAVVWLPPGTYLVSALTITVNGTVLAGPGVGLAKLKASTAASDVVTIGSARSGCRIEGVAIIASVTRTGGWYVVNDSDGFAIDKFATNGAHGGIKTTGTTVTISRGSMRDGIASVGVAIQVDDGADVSIRDIVMDQAAQIAAGIRITSTSDTTIEDCNIIHSGSALHLAPASGATISSVWASNSYFDTSVRGLYINATGNVVRAMFTGCWFSSATSEGVRIVRNGTGTVQGAMFTGCHIFLNGTSGLVVGSTGCTDVRMVGCAVAGNTVDGVQIAAGVTDFAVQDCRIGNSHGVGVNTHDGILVNAGASAGYLITGNDLRGNTTANLSDGGTGTKVVANNLTA